MNSVYCQDREYNLTTTNTITIKTPLYAASYPDNLKCTWFISKSDAGYVFIRFVSFVGVETNYDFLDIGFGMNVSEVSRIVHLSGLFAPNSLSMDSNHVWVRFTSNEMYGWYGFELTIQWRDSPGKLIDDILQRLKIKKTISNNVTLRAQSTLWNDNVW